MSRNTQVERTCPICNITFKVKRKEARDVNCCCVDHANVWKNKKRQNEVAAPFGIPIRELLTNLYWEQQLGVKQIAKALNISDHTAWSWLDDLGIERRDRSSAVALQWVDNTERRLQSSEAMRLLNANGTIDNRGESNPHWRGGKIPVTEYGNEWLTIRKLVKERDDFRCQACGSSDNLNTHHIDPFRECRKHEMNNLITLCASCHNLVHSGKIECPQQRNEMIKERNNNG